MAIAALADPDPDRFLLWFYGLGPQRMPEYVAGLLQRMCTDKASVAPLFRDPLPENPSAVRIVFYEYHSTTRAEKKQTGNWWRREQRFAMPPVPCTR